MTVSEVAIVMGEDARTVRRLIKKGVTWADYIPKETKNGRDQFIIYKNRFWVWHEAKDLLNELNIIREFMAVLENSKNMEEQKND